MKGDKFGYYTATGRTKRDKAHKLCLEAVCICGKTVYLQSYTLSSGKSKSCGCKRNELAKKAYKHTVKVRKKQEKKGKTLTVLDIVLIAVEKKNIKYNKNNNTIDNRKVYIKNGRVYFKIGNIDVLRWLYSLSKRSDYNSSFLNLH